MSPKPFSNFPHRDLLPANRFDTGETKPDKTNKEFDSRLASCRRGRVSTVALCTLATLAAQDLSHQALAMSTLDDASQPQKDGGDIVVPDSKEQPESKEVTLERTRRAIASPESVAVQEFAPEAVQPLESPTAQPEQDAQKVVAPTAPTVISSAPQTIRPAIAPPETEVLVARTSTQKDSSIPEMPSSAPKIASAAALADIQSRSARDLLEVPSVKPSAVVAANSNTPTTQETVNSQQSGVVVAQGVPATEPCLEVEGLQTQLGDLEKLESKGEFRASPALSIYIPTGFGADDNTAFVSGTFQERTRYGDVSDGALGIGVGLGDARKAVGVELSYAIASFGSSRDFGSGGFNAKVHRQLSDSLSVAAGWNGFLNLGGDNDFENSVYGTATKIFRTRDNINSPFSRVAVTAGVGNGQFRSEDDIANDRDGINVFGNVAVRVAQPVSLIAEWSGQDLGVGVSIAPFKNIPLVITPAVRDLAGAGDGPRFVLGTGFAYKF